ncbi:unnamed protein product [Calypogeia fissa]
MYTIQVALESSEMRSSGGFNQSHHQCVRDFIHSALYDEKDGYFAARSDAVGALPEPLNFSRFEGRRAYSEYLANVYKQGGSSWFTPVELFQVMRRIDANSRVHLWNQT